jgi:hypothetical protein
MTKNILRRIIADSTWQVAKSMPRIPHCYTIRKNAPSDEDFVALVEVIRSHGYDEKFYSRFYRYLDLDCWQYWIMDEHVECTTLINRARLNRADRPIQKNPVPLVPRAPLTEYYCPESKRMVPVQPTPDLDANEEHPE